MKVNPTIKDQEVLLRLKIERLKGGEYLATSPSLPGLIAQGRSLQEALEIAQDVGRKLIESYQDHGDPLPEEIKKQLKKKPSPKFLEIPLAVHA